MNRRLDTAMGALSGLALVALGMWGADPGLVQGPGQITSAREYRVEHLGEGRLRWRLLDGSVPGGPVTAAEGVLVEVRGEPLELVVAERAAAGRTVEAGETLVTIQLPVANAQLDAAVAERDAALGELEVLQAGGRPGDVAAARASVEVAKAALAQARANAEVVGSLAESGAGSAFDYEAAELRVALAQARVDAARASESAARDAPHNVEVDTALKRVRAADARVASARVRTQTSELTSPFTGVTARPGGDILVSVHDDSVPLVQATLPEVSVKELIPGATGRFRITGQNDTIPATLVALGQDAQPTERGPVVWVLARLDGSAPRGATGVLTLPAGEAW